MYMHWCTLYISMEHWQMQHERASSADIRLFCCPLIYSWAFKLCCGIPIDVNDTNVNYDQL